MGDEGLSLGAGLSFRRLSARTAYYWLEQRYRPQTMFTGGVITTARSTPQLTAEPDLARLDESGSRGAQARLADGQIGAIFRGRMEFGPRLWRRARSLPIPRSGPTHDELNRRLQRSEFMPFAPVVTEENAGRVFDIDSVSRYACRFMTITTEVLPSGAGRSRPSSMSMVRLDQIIRRDINPLYHDIVDVFEAATGIPALINTELHTCTRSRSAQPPGRVRARLRRSAYRLVVTENGLCTTRTQII